MRGAPIGAPYCARIAASCAARRVGDVDAQHEAVELRFRQRISALELVRVLRREDDEPVGQRKPLALDRHLALFHRLEQRRLRLRAGAIDLVHQ